MSEQARIETAIDTTIDNCEVLRARLAKYEDADGKPITTIAEQAREIEKLEAGIPRLQEQLYQQRKELTALKAQPDPWKASGADWCSSIHSNPDAKAWADFFVAVFPGLTDKHDLMLGWFANAMMAMHDHLKAQPGGVVQWPDADEIMQMAFEEGQPSEDASGYYFELEEFDLFIQRLMEEVARLSQAASAGGLNVATGCVTTLPVVVMDWDDEGEEVQSLYTHPADQVAEGVVVARERLEHWADKLEDSESSGYGWEDALAAELRALLNGGRK